MDPIDALKRIAFLLERSQAPTYRVQAFRRAIDALAGLPEGEFESLAAHGRLRSVKGIGDTTERILMEAFNGGVPEYLQKLEGEPEPDEGVGAELRAALRGDCHTHSLWSDGGSPILEMARAARALGHEYIVMTDHSPRLKIANGLTVGRLQKQLEEINGVNKTLKDETEPGAPVFRVLTGIEVDILEDGGIDQTPEMLEMLDVVVASVHSKLRMESGPMTARMIKAVANPHVDILGHCTGRLIQDKQRPPSTFDAKAVFTACQETGTAVEINSRPERKDPPLELLRLAVDVGCIFSIDTDAHAPGQLEWQYIGCSRAVECGVDADSVVNTYDIAGLKAALKS